MASPEASLSESTVFSKRINLGLAGQVLINDDKTYKPAHKSLVKPPLNAYTDVSRGARSNFWSETSSNSIICVCEKRRIWQDCA